MVMEDTVEGGEVAEVEEDTEVGEAVDGVVKGGDLPNGLYHHVRKVIWVATSVASGVRIQSRGYVQYHPQSMRIRPQ